MWLAVICLMNTVATRSVIIHSDKHSPDVQNHPYKKLNQVNRFRRTASFVDVNSSYLTISMMDAITRHQLVPYRLSDSSTWSSAVTDTVIFQSPVRWPAGMIRLPLDSERTKMLTRQGLVSILPCTIQTKLERPQRQDFSSTRTAPRWHKSP